LTEVRPARPLLATLICIFEAASVVLVVAAHFLVNYLRSIHNSLRTGQPLTYSPPPLTLHASPLHYAAMGLSYIIALAAAIALWQMRRSAFYLLAAGTALSLASFAVGLLRAGMAIHLSQIIGLLTLVLSAAITWYAYRITLPRVELAPIPESEPPVVDVNETVNNEYLNENQSVSQFYIAHINDRKDRN
jgi:hypothetical protein